MNRRYQRTATAITSGGNRNPANADFGGSHGRGRVVDFTTQVCLRLANAQCNGAGQTDPNKLHDLQAGLAQVGVYAPEHVDRFVELFLSDADRSQLDPILDRCTAEYVEHLDEDEQISFKGMAKAFVRTYSFLSHPAIYKRRVGETVNIPGDVDPEAASPRRGRPVSWNPRND